MSTSTTPTVSELSNRPSRPTVALPDTSDIPTQEFLELATQRLALRKPFATLALYLVLRRLSQLSEDPRSIDGTQFYSQYSLLDLSPLAVALDTELQSVVAEVLEVEDIPGTEEVEDLWELVKTEWRKVAGDIVVAAAAEEEDGEGIEVGGRLLGVLSGALEGLGTEQRLGETGSQWVPDGKRCDFKPVGSLQELLYAFVEEFIGGPH